MGNEKLFEIRVKNFLKENGCWFVKYWGGGEFTRTGIPDLLACYKGRFLGIEIKSENGRPSPLQLHNLEEIDKAGGYAILLFPNQYDLFREFIGCIKANNLKKEREYYSELRERWKT